MATLFISDLHLSPDLPKTTDCFVRFMRQEAITADALYVLGDLFEFWIGDDDPSEFAQQIRDEFRALTAQGVPCYIIQGNRDFLLGRGFCKQTGVTLLNEHTVIDLYGQPALIMHGDTLCIEDVKYQQFRKKVHSPWIQRLFKALPFFVRKRIVQRVQTDIRQHKGNKSLDIMDVTQSEVEKVMTDANVTLLIHGHTHRPNIHEFSTNGHPMQRIVLGDWYHQGSVLICDPGQRDLQVRNFVPT